MKKLGFQCRRREECVKYRVFSVGGRKIVLSIVFNVGGWQDFVKNNL